MHGAGTITTECSKYITKKGNIINIPHFTFHTLLSASLHLFALFLYPPHQRSLNGRRHRRRRRCRRRRRRSQIASNERLNSKEDIAHCVVI
jgi:hypothetical protein